MPKIDANKTTQDTEKAKKPGFLGLDFKVGEGLPKEVWPHTDIPVFVGEKGELEWEFRPMEEVFAEQVRGLSDQQRHKWDYLWRLISQSFKALKMAELFGSPARRRFSPFLSHRLQSPPVLPKFLTQESRAIVPIKIQEHILRGAYKFRYPDVTFDEEGKAYIPQKEIV